MRSKNNITHVQPPTNRNLLTVINSGSSISYQQCGRKRVIDSGSGRRIYGSLTPTSFNSDSQKGGSWQTWYGLADFPDREGQNVPEDRDVQLGLEVCIRKIYGGHLPGVLGFIFSLKNSFWSERSVL
jgi:hypothetical protein